MTIDWRDYPDGFIGVCEDADIAVHIAQDASAASLDDAIQTAPVFSGSLHAYLTDIDRNPGFHETFGSETTPAAIHAALRDSGVFVFGGGASATFALVPADPKPHQRTPRAEISL